MWRVLGLRVRPGDKTAIVTVEGSHVSATKEGAPGAKQNKGHVTGVFFYSEVIVHHEYAPDGQTINKEFCVEVLRRLRESVRRKRLEKWRDGDWIVHHDNAPTHTSQLVQQFWPNTAPLSCNSRHTHQISHRVTFSYSQGLRKFWKDADLRQRRASNEIRRKHHNYTPRKRSSQNVSKSGGNVGRSV